MRTSKVNRLSRVNKESDKSKGSSTNVSPESSLGQGEDPQSNSSPSATEPTPDPNAGPGNTTLRRDERLADDYIKRMREQLGNADEWNKGQSGGDGDGEPGELVDGEGEIPGVNGDIADEQENRTYGEIEAAIEQANREVIQMQPRGRESKTDDEKGTGGSSAGGFRDRLVMEGKSKTDWAKLFSTRLSAYSNEMASRKPYHRSFVGNKMMRNRITSKTIAKDTLPETNLIIDTSSSLSYAELLIIMTEVQRALEAAKIKKLNMILWTSTAYYHQTYKNVTSKTFPTILKDLNDNWVGGGNDVNSVYRLMKKKGWIKKFTIHLTDGMIQDHKSGETQKLSSDVLDPNNTIFGIIFPSRGLSVNSYNEIVDLFPGEKIPIFLDSDKFFK